MSSPRGSRVVCRADQSASASSHTSSGQQITTTYGPDEVDAIAAYCEELDECYLIPIELVARRRGIRLRSSPPKNGQRAGLNWTDAHRLDGAVAQLGRAPGWHPGGQGFESPQLHSTPTPGEGDRVIGAHKFR
jgi:hypothetical protein